MLKRTPLKRTIGTLKKSSIKKKSKSLEQKKEQQDQYEADWRFYREIWEEREHRCQVTGEWLGNELKTIFIEHLLEKSVYPQFRYEKRNIALVSGDIHIQKTNGFPHPIHKQLIKKAKKELLENV